MAYKLPKLNYAYDALEPYIDAKTMEIHYSKHHQTYIDKLNNAIQKVNYQVPKEIFELCLNIAKFPEFIQQDLVNHGGGHANHTFFWSILSINKSKKPSNELAKSIEKYFNSFQSMKEKFTESALNHFGSGWTWLYAKKDNSLCICSTTNQGNPIINSTIGNEVMPILGIDIWEHAYYINYQNRRLDYINAFWNIINWEQVNYCYNNWLKK